MTRTIGHRLLDGAIEVFAIARSIPEALALESAMRQVAPAAAFVPETPPTPELTPEQEARLAATDPPEPIDVLNVDKPEPPL